MTEIVLTPQQEAHIAALAARTGRNPNELVSEAVELWETRRVTSHATESVHSPAEAAARIRELRRGVFLPEGETIKDLINFGRS